MRDFEKIKGFLEYLGGNFEAVPTLGSFRFLKSRLARGLWWGFLAAAILLFCGQRSKFIYIDF